MVEIHFEMTVTPISEKFNALITRSCFVFSVFYFFVVVFFGYNLLKYMLSKTRQ